MEARCVSLGVLFAGSGYKNKTHFIEDFCKATVTTAVPGRETDTAVREEAQSGG